MGQRIVYALHLATADADGVAASQTPLGAGNLTINGALASGGIATTDVPRRIIITSAGNDSSLTFTVYGNQRVDGTGNSISEAVTGGNIAAASTTLDFGTVTRISVSGATAAAVIAGTNGVASTPWVSVNRNAQPVNVAIVAVASGTVNYTVQYTYDDVFFSTSLPTIIDDPVVAAVTATRDTTFNDPFTAYRVTLNSGTGTVTMTGIQAGIKG